MKKIGLVGGISWVSTMDYYKFINEGINARLGGLNFAECVVYSLNFQEIQTKTWPHSFDLLLNACQNLKQAGVDGIVLCANTAHLFADEIQAMIGLPVIHIGEATAKTVKRQALKKVGLLGTKFTMEMSFYRNKLENHGLEVLIPDKAETRDYIQFTLKKELGIGLINPATKANYIQIIEDLIARGAEGIILGCTEISLLISQDDCKVPVFDTTKIHSAAIVDYILS